MDADFQTEFLRDLTRENPGPLLALFGKHPSWDDHMDDLGLSSSSLRMCKRWLYIQGIAANASRQQSLPAETGFHPYQHLLLWVRGPEVILLRLVESADGRGRGFFPLVGAVHFRAANLEQAISRLSTPLLEFVDACRLLRSRNDVVDLHRITQVNLRRDVTWAEIHTANPGAPSGGVSDALPGQVEDGSFVRYRIPTGHKDPAESFIDLIPWGNDQPVLLVRRDDEPEITICSGQPGREDFWLLREKHGTHPGDHEDASG